MREHLARALALTSLIVVVALSALFAVQQQQRQQALTDTLDPLYWQALYPLHVASYLQGRDAGNHPPVDKLAANPFRAQAWAGNAFALEYNKSRAHYYAQIDQQQSQRTLQREQPAGCIHCHAAEAPELVNSLGWDTLNAMSYNAIRDKLHIGSSCADCHDPATMQLRITRPALTTALAQLGIDISNASQQDMRTYVCAQCHVEYYFQGAGNELVFPWANGLEPDSIETYYNTLGFSDWRHADTDAGLIKIQHPNFELHSQGPHGRRDIACADCHMPRVTFQGSPITDHWIRSPMTQLQAACMSCHRGTEERLRERTESLQAGTDILLQRSEQALTNLMHSISAAAGSASPELLESAREAHRAAQLRWDFVDADASRGFHAPALSRTLLEEAAERAGRAAENLQTADAP